MLKLKSRMIHALTGLAVIASASAAFADVTWDAVKSKITSAVKNSEMAAAATMASSARPC